MQATLTKPQTIHQPIQKGFSRSQITQRPPKDIVFVSGELPSLHLLTQGVLPGKDVVVLHPAMDGVVQIARHLAAVARPVRSLHILAHGAPGELYLGAGVLSLDSLEKYSLALRMVKTYLTADATLSLYACNLAKTLPGQQLVQMLHYWTGAEVGASTTPIGAADQGGNWTLDYATSGFQGETAFSEGAMATYPHILETGGTGSGVAVVDPNPDLGLVDVGSFSDPAFADIDGDGDKDFFVGGNDGNIRFARNTGTPTDPMFALTQTNPFGLQDIGNRSTPTLTDIDNDGDFDLFAGDTFGRIRFFQNVGDGENPRFAAPVINPFGLRGAGGLSNPAFGDLDGDGDQDLLFGTAQGEIIFFTNVGDASNPSFRRGDNNPFGLENLGRQAAPTLVDVDSDNDLDVFIGLENGNTAFFRNFGTPTAPQFGFVAFGVAVTPTGESGRQLFPDVGDAASPVLVDIDNNGRLDVFTGEQDGTINFQDDVLTGSDHSGSLNWPGDALLSGGQEGSLQTDSGTPALLIPNPALRTLTLDELTLEPLPMPFQDLDLTPRQGTADIFSPPPESPLEGSPLPTGIPLALPGDGLQPILVSAL